MIKNNLLEEYCKVSRNFYYKNPLNFEKIINGGNEMRDSCKTGNYKIIGFADKHFKRMKNMFFFKRKIQKYKIIDQVQIFNLSNIDKDFLRRNNALFSDKKIFPWIAKAYLVNKVLKESEYGDTILWIDSDIRDIKENGIENLFNLCNNSEKGLVGFHSDFWLERSFTKIDLFNYLNLKNKNYSETTQAYGNIFLFKKNKFCVEFFNKFLNLCSNNNLMDYSPSIQKESKHFVIHQNDQSILSLLYKINNIKTFPIPFYNLFPTNIIAQHSGYFNDGIKLPIVWEPCWHDVTYKQMWESCNKKYNKKISPDDCLAISSEYFHL